MYEQILIGKLCPLGSHLYFITDTTVSGRLESSEYNTYGSFIRNF